MVAEALREAARRLEATSDTARLDAELLMAHALGTTRSPMLLHMMADPAPSGFAASIERRARHEPVAYITGQQQFYGLDLEVNPAVLIPRADSETLIEAARRAFAYRAPPRRILDLGTGSGALLLAALSIWPAAEGIGIERDPEAVATASRNAARHGGTASIHELDWSTNGWRKHLGRFDLVLANPPYVETGATLEPSVRDWEPAGALFAGSAGLDAYRLLIPQLPSILEPGGIVVVEIGATQAHSVQEIAENSQLCAKMVHDLGDRPRALVLVEKDRNRGD